MASSGVLSVARHHPGSIWTRVNRLVEVSKLKFNAEIQELSGIRMLHYGFILDDFIVIALI
jgi:hypothetical protein